MLIESFAVSFFSLFLICLGVYYGIVLMETFGDFGKITKKSDFWFALIPFQWWIKCAIEKYQSLM